MNSTLKAKHSITFLLPLFFLFAMPSLSSCYGFSPAKEVAKGIIFEEDFDSSKDWSLDGSVRKDCGTNCTDAPTNWDAYYAQPPVGNLSTVIGPIPGNVTAEQSKAFLAYYNNIKYSGGAELSKTFPVDYPELYLRVWIKTQPGWKTAPDSSIKLFRVIHYDRSGSAFKYFSGGSGAPMGLLNWGTSSRWRGEDGCYIPLLRCDPQETNYYCPQPPYNIDTPQKIKQGVSPGATGGFADGEWHRYDLHVKMNTPYGQDWNSDGVWEFWYDGVLVRSITDIKWKYPGSTVAIGWNTIQFGGNSDNQFGGEPTSQWVAFDGIVVSTAPLQEGYAVRPPK